ncbi:MAG: protoporphyrinogen oxidase [Coriobacteriia bacterium]|nr:protoporphyrinogen oxidase [Coriobacteriia bacterium]
MKRIVVIGGGVAGLGAAFKIRRAANEGADVTFTLVEKDPRLGGKLQTEKIGDFIVDGGSDAFIAQKPAVMRVAKLAGFDQDRMPSDESRKKTLILKKGRLYEMPDGVMQFAPTKFVPFATTGLFSWSGKIRAGMDLFIPKKKVAPGELNDETLESLVKRRMGQEILDRLAEPLVGGVHASDPKLMSLAATFPNLLEMEQKYGCLIKGFLAQRTAAEEMKKKYPADPMNPRTFFNTFKEGMQQLPEGMADAAGRENIRTGVLATRVEHLAGDGWKVHLSNGDALEADAVIVATEGWAASDLLATVDSELSELIGTIPHSSSATISMGFDTDDLGFDLNAFGVLCPGIEKRSLMAATYSSTKWTNRAPKGKALLRGFVGGPHNQEIMQKSDDELIEIVKSEFRAILGLKVEPAFARVYRWVNGMPQYTMGHLDRVARIEHRVSMIPTLGVGGGSYRGVGIANCIESGEAAVTKVLGELGFGPLAEDTAPAAPRAY